MGAAIDPDPAKKAFGGRVVIKLQDGTTLVDESPLPTRPAGARPFAGELRSKVRDLAAAASDGERSAFIDAAGRVADLLPKNSSD